MSKPKKPVVKKFKITKRCLKCPLLKEWAKERAIEQVLEKCVRMGYMDKVE